MPVFRSGQGRAPAWCEMEDFELIDLEAGEEIELQRSGKKEELIVSRGILQAVLGDVVVHLTEGGKLSLNSPEVPSLRLIGAAEATQVFRAMGRWESIAGSGLFTVETGTPPTFDTPYTYSKTTPFDNHYHDCDEYWVVLEGKATVTSEGRTYSVGPGDCVATGMGWHHDVVRVDATPFRAIWLEGTLEGRKRVGHLWEPKHGIAEPARDRI